MAALDVCVCVFFFRRESERRNHSLARHADILAAVETRLSLLNMTFMKYVDSNLCCFIPGKVKYKNMFCIQIYMTEGFLDINHFSDFNKVNAVIKSKLSVAELAIKSMDFIASLTPLEA